MHSPNKSFRIASLGLIAACIMDMIMPYLLGLYYPGYHQLQNSISALGTQHSPVATLAEFTWLVIGLIFIWFGIEFGRQYKGQSRPAMLASWLIIIYGAGEGLGSAFFKVDAAHHALSVNGFIHQLVSILGTLGILILPLVVKKIYPFTTVSGFGGFSKTVFTVSIILLALFLCRFILPGDHVIVIYKGLWQRLLLLTNYVYLLYLIYLMWKKAGFKTDSDSHSDQSYPEKI